MCFRKCHSISSETMSEDESDVGHENLFKSGNNKQSNAETTNFKSAKNHLAQAIPVLSLK